MGQSTDWQGLGQVREKAHEQIDRTADELEGAAKAISDQGRQLSENVQEVGTNVRRAAEESMRDEPFTTLAVAAVLGFLLGAVWKS